MLLIFTSLWIAGLTFTVWKRDRQLKAIIERLTKYLHEQEIKKEREEAEKTSDNPK